MTEQLKVIHQPSKVTILEDGSSVPLYCIASGHRLAYAYTWSMVGGDAVPPVKCPVLWTSTPGFYTCTVHYHMQSCTSTAIEVVESIKKGKYIYNCPFPGIYIHTDIIYESFNETFIIHIQSCIIIFLCSYVDNISEYNSH